MKLVREGGSQVRQADFLPLAHGPGIDNPIDHDGPWGHIGEPW